MDGDAAASDAMPKTMEIADEAHVAASATNVSHDDVDMCDVTGEGVRGAHAEQASGMPPHGKGMPLPDMNCG